MTTKNPEINPSTAAGQWAEIVPASLFHAGLFPGLSLDGRNQLAFNPSTGQLALVCMNPGAANLGWLNTPKTSTGNCKSKAGKKTDKVENQCANKEVKSKEKIVEKSKEVKSKPKSKGAVIPKSPPAKKTKRSSTKQRKPKRPKTAYNFFQLSVHQSVWSEVCPDKTRPIDRVQHNEKVARIIGKRWKALSEKDRQTFQSMADRDKLRCQRENEDYIKRMQEESGIVPPAKKKMHEVEEKELKSSGAKRKKSPVADTMHKKTIAIREQDDDDSSDEDDVESEERDDFDDDVFRHKRKRGRYGANIYETDHESDVSTEEKFDSDDSDDSSDELTWYENQVIRDPGDLARNYSPEEWDKAAETFAGALVRHWRIENPFPF